MINLKEGDLKSIANILRRDVLNMTGEAGSGHPSSCLSCADIMSVLFFNEMRYDNSNHNNKDNDEFVLSKGHAAPILYSALWRAGCIKENLYGLRKIESRLEGHPMPNSLNWIKIASGSLGQGLSAGVGMALAGKKEGRKFRTFVLLGDSEMAEGSNYEAMEIASHYKLDNLVAIVDINGLGQRGETMDGKNLEVYKKRFDSFGWESIIVEGHDINNLINAFKRSKESKKPFVILAKTIKGKGVSFIENKNGWHGKSLNETELKKALQEIKEEIMPKIEIIKPKEIKIKERGKKKVKFNEYKKNEEISTREAYGNALVNLVKSNKKIMVLDGEVSNSTYSYKVNEYSKDNFVECYIAEQNMIGMGLGMSKKGFNVFASSFSAFLSRAHDQIRMASLSSADMSICGSHSGVSIGEDGASQMGLEDISMFRALPNSIVFSPSDGVSTEKIVEMSSRIKGIKYIRTTRGKTKIIYGNKEKFELGEYKVLRESKKDECVVVCSGITVHEGLKAYDELKKKGKDIAIVDIYCIKPFNGRKFVDFVRKHGKRVLVVEDHRPEGGIGEMISGVISGENIGFKHLSINSIPHSGKSAELLERYGIDYKSIEKHCI